MVRVYDYNEGSKIKVFFSIRDGVITTVSVGNRAVSTKTGIQIYVDDYVSKQLDKCELYLDGMSPKLRVKDGEVLEKPKEDIE